MDTAPNLPGIRKLNGHSPSRRKLHTPRHALVLPPWIEEDEGYMNQFEVYPALQRQRERFIKNHSADRWDEVPEEAQSQSRRRSYCATIKLGEPRTTHKSGQSGKFVCSSRIVSRKQSLLKLLHRQCVPSAISLGLRLRYGIHTQPKKVIRSL